MDIFEIQKALQDQNIEGWLFYNFHGQNVIASRILGLGDKGMQSRRYFYFIPAEGEPKKLVHRIEDFALDELPGEKIRYLSYQSLEEGLKQLTHGVTKLAMEYSPKNAIPYVSLVDAGTIELVKSLDKEVVSSANLIQQFESPLTQEQIDSHCIAAKLIKQFVCNAFDEIRNRISKTGEVKEHFIQNFLMKRFEEHNLITYAPPIVAVNENAGNPHYEPHEGQDASIHEDNLVLIDLWAKQNKPKAVYADITWMAFTGNEIPTKFQESFSIIANARDAAFNLVNDRFDNSEAVQGWEVDDAARKVITDAGHANCFIHRTGHSIGEEVHGNGTNMDNLETRDERLILPSTLFSIEPGIYTNTFGMRTEIDVLITKAGKAEITGGPAQTQIVSI